MNEESPSSPRPHGSRARIAAWSIGGFLLCMVFGLVLMAAIAWHLLRTESGSRRLLAHVPYVSASGTRGALWGDFDAERVVVTLPGDGGTITLQGLGWRGLSFSRADGKDAWLRIAMADLHASRVDVALKPKPGSGEPMTEPTQLRLPVEVELSQLGIGEIDLAALGNAPLRDLRASIRLGANGGAQHRIDGLHVAYGPATGPGTGPATAPMTADGAISIGTDAPFTLDAKLAIASPSNDLRANATLTGPLAQPSLVAALHARGAASQPEQTVEARATLAPFAAWPLSTLQASTQALDLSALIPGAPVTSLTGHASATSTAADQPITAQADLVNERAGPWNEAHLPVRRLEARLRLKADDPNHLTLEQFTAELGSQAAAAGQLEGRGAWSSASWNVDATLRSVMPSRLDARAPVMVLSGPVTLKGSAFDQPERATVDLLADIAGRFADSGPARDARLHAAATLNARRIEIREITASAGSAKATLAGTATQADASSPWKVKAQAALADFDPTPWWPGDPGSAWRRGPHRLNAKTDVDLSTPIGGDRTIWQQLAALRGNATLALSNSQLAGVPIAANIALRATEGRSIAVQVQLDAGGNRMTTEGQLSTAQSGADDHWQVALDAPTLASLSPILRLGGAAAGDLAGSAHAKATVVGRWPSISTQGDLDATGLRAGPASVQQALASWQLALVANGTTKLEATLTQAAWTDPHPPTGTSGRRVLDSVHATIDGTTGAHTLALDATTGALPPAWTDALMARGPATPSVSPVAQTSAVATAESSASGTAATTAASATTTAPATPARSVAILRARGGLIDAPSADRTASPLAFAGWHGTVQQVDLHPTTAPDAPWLRSRDIAIEARWADAASVTVQAGRAEVLGGAIRWSNIGWQAATAGQPAKIDVDAELEPLRVSPLLARLQPAFGWGGDLTIGGHVRLHSAPTFSADVVVERRGGDLGVTDELGTQQLGLTDLRLALVAKDGTWNITEALAGRNLGNSAGAIVIHTSPEAMMPGPDAPLSGTLEARVADLGALGSWVPAGWRLAGAVHASATLGGRFGAPDYTGQIVGSRLGVRNFLQGVDVTEGELQVTLQGTTARIDRFTAKAGSGTVKLGGEASFGEAPQADLALTADHFQLLGRVDRKVIVSGQSDIRWRRDALGITGKFGIDEGLIDFTRSDAPSLGDDVTVVRRSTTAPSATPPALPDDTPTATARETKLDLQVGLGEKLHLKGRGIDTDLRGDLRITSPGGKLAVVGIIRTFGGTYAAYRQKLTIDRGTIAFNGAVDNPQLDIQATRSDTDVKVGVVVTGSAVEPRVRLYSEPEVSDMDKLSWLVLGRASDGLGSSDTALLQQAALALLAGDGPSRTDEFTKAIGLDDIAIKQNDDGTSKQTVLALGKQLSRRWYVGYQRGLSATAGSFQLVYRLAQRLTVRAQSGSDNSLDVIWTLRWH